MDYFKIIHHELLQRLIYFGPSGYEVGFVSDAHTAEQLDWAASQICEVIELAYQTTQV